VTYSITEIIRRQRQDRSRLNVPSTRDRAGSKCTTSFHKSGDAAMATSRRATRFGDSRPQHKKKVERERRPPVLLGNGMTLETDILSAFSCALSHSSTAPICPRHASHLPQADAAHLLFTQVGSRHRHSFHENTVGIRSSPVRTHFQANLLAPARQRIRELIWSASYGLCRRKQAHVGSAPMLGCLHWHAHLQCRSLPSASGTRRTCPLQ
jgi:hypothetical protein